MDLPDRGGARKASLKLSSSMAESVDTKIVRYRIEAGDTDLIVEGVMVSSESMELD
jgi:hypothetical protein